MNTECESDVATELEVEQPWRRAAMKLSRSTVESRPLITCECALWGSPCPHSFWSEEKPNAAASKAA